MGVCVEVPEIGALGPTHAVQRTCLTQKALPHMLPCQIWSFYVIPCGRRVSKIGSTGGPLPWNGGRGRLLKAYPIITMPNLVVLAQTVRENVQRSGGNMDPSRRAFQGNSRSSESTRFSLECCNAPSGLQKLERWSYLMVENDSRYVHLLRQSIP